MNKTGLHPVPRKDQLGRKVWCGPYAVAAVTGVSVDAVVEAITGGKHIARTGRWDLTKALEALGFGCTSESLDGRSTDLPTFAQWIRKEQHSRTDAYLVLITDHWVVVRGDWLQCSSYREPRDLGRSNPYARKRVRSVIRVKGVKS